MFCPACGRALVATTAQPLPSLTPAGSDLTTLSHVVMVYQGGLGRTNFTFEDPSGRLLGATTGEITFPLKYTLFDANQQPVLILDGSRARGLLYDYLVHDPAGQVLASARQESSFMSRKYSVTVGDTPRMTLTSDAVGYHYQLVENDSGTVLASGDRTSGLRRSFVDLTFSDPHSWDHRIGIGLMLLLYYICTRRTA
jgi:hypothetical protein